MSSSTDVNKLIFNQMSDNKYSTIVPVEGQFYCTPDIDINGINEALNNKADISLLDNKVDKQLTGYISVTCQNGFAGTVGYFIKDGWCTVRFWHLKGGSVAQGQYPLGDSQQLPRPYGYAQYACPLCMANNGGQVGIWVYWEANDPNLKCHCYNATNNCYGTFTYPVA